MGCLTEIFKENEKKIYIGTLDASKDLSRLKNAGIVAIINIAGSGNLFQNELEYLTINIKDKEGQDIKKYFDRSSAFIKKQLKDGNVLVHCKGGISRSATIIIAYLIRHHEFTYKSALALCKERRGCVQPNASFVEQLVWWEENYSFGYTNGM